MDNVIPIDRGTPSPAGLPAPGRDQRDAIDPRARERAAKETLEFHDRGLDSRRLHDLTAEMYLLHIDGEGDGQWYGIHQGTRLSMISLLDGMSQTQDNQLASITDNFVAHLTTQPFRLVAEFKPDRVSRMAALVDQAIVNSEVRSQKWNKLFSHAKYMGAATGFCPIHSMWRDDVNSDDFETIGAGQQPGSIDSFVGNPFDHVFNAGAVAGSHHRQTWGRSLPASLVRAAFPQVKGLEGNTRIPSASAYQRVLRKWVNSSGMAASGHAELTSSEGHEEQIALIYDEILPGVMPDYPEGLLRIVALQGAATTKSEEARGTRGRPILLWEGPLPARSFSSVITYTHHRFDDIHGKPYIADPDYDQVELNMRLALLKRYQQRASRPSLGGSGAIDEDTVGFDGDTFYEMEATIGASGTDLQWLEFPNRHVPFLQAEIKDIYDRMYRKAGWQAPSRGEAGGASGKAIIALQTADDSIMGPISLRTAEEVEDLAQLNWKLRKEFMDKKSVLEVVGDELAHMVEPYVDRTMMSDTPPRFRLVSGFGTSTEAKAQQLLNLVGVTDALGEPLLTAKQFKKKYPDQSLYEDTDDPSLVRERRPRIINQMLRDEAEEQTEFLQQQLAPAPVPGQPQQPQQESQWQPSMADPFSKELAFAVEMTVAEKEDVLMDDDIMTHVEALSILTQDPTEHPVARLAAIQRQNRYFMWAAGQQMAAAATAPGGPEGDPAEDEQPGGGGQGQTPSAEEAFHPAPEGGTSNAQSMVEADRQLSRETA